jgi:hypothetical protein
MVTALRGQRSSDGIDPAVLARGVWNVLEGEIPYLSGEDWRLQHALRKHRDSLSGKVDLKTQPIGPRPRGTKASRDASAFDLLSGLYRITGIDWAQVDGMDVLTAQKRNGRGRCGLGRLCEREALHQLAGIMPQQ